MAHGADEREAFLRALETTSFIGTACRKADVSRASVYRWMSTDLEFKAAVKQAVARSHDILGEAAYSVLQSRVKEKDLSASKFVLTHYPSTYAAQQQNTDIKKEVRERRYRDPRDMTLEERVASAHDAFVKAFTDEDGNWIVGRHTAEFMIEKGYMQREDIVGEVPDNPNDPARRNLTPPVPAHAVRVRREALLDDPDQ